MAIKELIPVKRAAEAIGCSPKHIYDLIEAGAIAAINIRVDIESGKTYRIPRSEIENFLKNRIVLP